MQPVIGVTSRPREIMTSGGVLWADTLQHTYRDSLIRGGGIPVILPPVEGANVPVLLGRLDGLLLTGGGDVDPSLYGSEQTDTMYGIRPERDEFELELVKRARDIKIPVMAICRGIQVLNVAFGGTLIEDIPSEIGSDTHTRTGEEVFLGHQAVHVDETSCLAALIGGVDAKVNSIHHQSLRDVAPDFRPVAWSNDGVIEAIEPVDDEWQVIGVQWHPEYLSAAGDAASDRLFAAFVDRARSFSAHA